MLIVKTPFRISLFGGGSDFPKYYLKNNGCVVGGTINKYCYVSARHLPSVFNYKHRIVWSKNETVNNTNEIVHPTVKAVFKHLNIKKGFEIHYQGDLQKNSGLGTSSAFCVGLLNALNSLENKMVDGDMMVEFFGGAFVTGGSVFQKIKQCMPIDLQEKQLKRLLREIK